MDNSTMGNIAQPVEISNIEQLFSKGENMSYRSLIQRMRSSRAQQRWEIDQEHARQEARYASASPYEAMRMKAEKSEGEAMKQLLKIFGIGFAAVISIIVIIVHLVVR